MLTAITRGVSASLARGELTFREREPIDVPLAREQHRAYERALESLGVRIDHLPAEDALPDAVFVEDPALVLDEVAVVTMPGAPSRAAETESLARAVARYRPVHRMTAPATLDGGDVVRVEREIYVGRSSRTNDAGIAQLHAILSPFGYIVRTVDVKGALHLKTACTYAGHGMLLVNSAWADVSAFRELALVEVARDEPWGASVLAIGETLVMPASFPRTRARLESLGLTVLPVDLSELQKAEGGPTCLSIVFDTPDD